MQNTENTGIQERVGGMLFSVLDIFSEIIESAKIWVAGRNGTGQNVTGQMSRTKRHIDKMSQDKTPHRQNGTGQNAT